jgi:hypothetical protein
VDQGKKLEELQAGVRLPPAVSTWESERSLKTQIKDAFEEITQGKPRGDLAH